MRTVNIATLKARLSAYIRLARAGETIRITDRQRPVAALSGLRPDRGIQVATLLVQQGRAEWHGGKPGVRPLKLRKGSAKLADAVLEDRG
jgi:prevent-host-death family protein